MTLTARLETFVQAVATDIKTLFGRSLPPGGAPGDVLAKSNAEDYAVYWATPSHRVFVQPTPPAVAAGTPYVWYQTGLGSDGNAMTIWVEDGA